MPLAFAEKLPATYNGDSSGTGLDQATFKELSKYKIVWLFCFSFFCLGEAIPGTPGEDYPIFSEPPETSFVCDGYINGYYADPEAKCQSFHTCSNDGQGGLNKHSFICPNGTVFNQQYFICDWWFNVDCSTVEDFYSLNDENFAASQAAGKWLA